MNASIYPLIAALLLSLGLNRSADKFDTVGSTAEATGPAAATASAGCAAPCPYPDSQTH